MSKYQTKLCPVCGDEFYTNDSKKKYCSSRCASRAASKSYQHPKAKLRVLQCARCSATFSTTNNNQIYCSKECSTAESKRKAEELKTLSAFKLFERDNFTCIYCGKSSIKDGVKLVMDHIFPRALGGKNDLINVITSCVDCNIQKSSTLLNQDIILELWERNQLLMNNSDTVAQYDYLIEHLNTHYKT